VRIVTWPDQVLRDFRFSARNLARNRSFTAVAIGR
jgi:hypothetical protein